LHRSYWERERPAMLCWLQDFGLSFENNRGQVQNVEADGVVGAMGCLTAGASSQKAYASSREITA